MKKIIFALSLLLSVGSLCAQEPAVPEAPAEDSLMHVVFLDRLTQVEDGKPVVTLQQDSAIYNLLGRPGENVPQNIVVVQNHPCVQMMGYRIQVFSSNNQKTAKTEAFSRETAMKQAMPGLSSYVKYQAPFWRVRVGDFQTYEDAYAQLVQFRKTFVFGREMSIVREVINLPL